MLNVWCAVGRMCADPELRYSDKGTAITNFTLAVDNGLYNGVKQTLFARCIGFDKRAEFICNYGKKGRLCSVSGKWIQREVQLSEVNFLDKSNTNDE